MKPVKFLIVGFGNRGEAYARYSLYYPYNMKIKAVIDPSPQRLKVCTNNYTGVSVFSDMQDFRNSTVSVDAAIITAPDQTHYPLARQFIEYGIPLLLEKPIAGTEEECRNLAAFTRERGTFAGVCHVLRYTPFFRGIKEIIDRGVLGEIVTMEHIEAVSFWHQAHSFVRGNWNNAERSSPMILSKSCHDMDILRWFAGKKCSRISSFGSLTHFRRANAPSGSTGRCTDGCSVENDCPYSALKIYLDPAVTGWPVSVITSDLSTEGRLKALQEGPYGRCVYRCGNNVVDHQVAALEFEGGITSSFTMTAFTASETDRRIRIMGTRGELVAENDSIEVRTFVDNQKQVYDVEPRGINCLSKHGGGDFGILEDFIRALRTQDWSNFPSTLEASLESHLMAFAAEKSRLTGQVVSLKSITGSAI